MKNQDFEVLKSKVKIYYEALLEDPYEEVFNALDVRVYSNLDKEFLGARVAVSLGGPNIYLDTLSGTMEGYWGKDEYGFEADDSLVMQVNDILEYEWNKK
jgi:hypothetical protein